MAPNANKSEAELKRALQATVRALFASNRESLTVNGVRKQCEDENGLEEGFFSIGGWKATSKEVVKAEVDKCTENDTQDQGADVASPAAKKGRPAGRVAPKAQFSGSKAKLEKSKPAAKAKARQRSKKADSASESELSESSAQSSESEEEAVLSDESEEDYEETNKSKRRSKKGARSAATARGKKRKVDESDMSSDEDGVESSSPPRKLAKKNGAKTSLSPSLSEEDENGVNSAVPSDAENLPTPNKALTKATHTKSADAEGDVSSSEMSVVIDEPPKPKRKSKDTSKKAPSKTKDKKPSARKSKAPAADLTPDEAEIKVLQGNLLKCGIRKIWGVELKQYGTDAKAKVRHLRTMLTDAGMEGRFSEARAREIKERRELQADLEAVTEMDKNWGAGRGSRAAAVKGRAAAAKADRSNDDEEEEDGSDDEGGSAAARPSKAAKPRDDAATGDGDEDGDADFAVTKTKSRSGGARAALAFLDDDDDSDSE